MALDTARVCQTLHLVGACFFTTAFCFMIAMGLVNCIKYDSEHASIQCGAGASVPFQWLAYKAHIATEQTHWSSEILL